MNVRIITTDGSHIDVERMDENTILPMVEALSNDAISVLAVALDNEAMTYIVKANIIRIDVG